MHVCVRNRRVLIRAFTKTVGFFSMHASGKVFQTLHSYLHGAGQYQFGWTSNNLKVVGVSGKLKVAFSRPVQIESCPNIVLLTDTITCSIVFMTGAYSRETACIQIWQKSFVWWLCVWNWIVKILGNAFGKKCNFKVNLTEIIEMVLARARTWMPVIFV